MLMALALVALVTGGGLAQAASRPVLRISKLDVSKPPAVWIYLTDLDSSLSPITDREAKHYRLAVDGVPLVNADKVQPLHTVSEPVALTLVFQVSPAMREVFTEAVEAAKRLVTNLPAGSKVGLVAYTDVVLHEVKPGNVTDVERAIDSLRIREDSLEVQLPDALKDALEGLESDKLPRLRLIVAFSDGLTTELNFAVFSELGRRAQDKGVSVHSIGYAPLEPAKLRTLHELSKAGGGTVREAGDATGVSQAFAALQEEIRNQLRLTYTLPKFFDGKLHDFQIETPGGQVSNIVAVELPAFTPKPSSASAWYRSTWFLLAMVGVIQIGLVLLVLAILRWRRKGASRAQLERGRYFAGLQQEDEDEDEDEEEAEEEEEEEDKGDAEETPDEDQPRRLRRPSERSMLEQGPGGRDASKRLRMEQLLQPSPGLLESSPSNPALNTLADTDKQLPTFRSGRLDPENDLAQTNRKPPSLLTGAGPSAVQRELAPTISPLQPLDQGQSSAAERRRPPSSLLPLPNPDELISGRVRNNMNDPGNATGELRPEAVNALPHPDEFMRRMGAGLSSPDATAEQPLPVKPVAEVGDSSPAQRPPSGLYTQDLPGRLRQPPTGSISGSGIPLPQGAPSPLVVPVGLPAEAGVMAGKFLDRKTKVMAVEDINHLDYVAWIIPLDLVQPDAVPAVITIHDGFSLEDKASGYAAFSLGPSGFGLQTVGSRGEPLSQLLNDDDHFFFANREFVFKFATRNPLLGVPAVRLEVLSGIDEGRSAALPEGEVVTIGAHPSCSLVVRGEGVARSHAIAFRKGRVCILSDLGTSRGFGYQGQQVGYQSIQSGEEVMIGSVRVVYTFTADVER